MKQKIRVTSLLIIAFVILILGMAVGSVFVTPADSLSIVWHKLAGTAVPATIKATDVSIIWNLRLPRALLAFVVGAALSVAGAVMQSVLKNPLASSYTLGVSSGASLGAALVILGGISIPLLKMFTLPILGFAFGLGTILLSITIASRLDKGLENNTIILTGMVISLFTNAVVTLVSALSREHIQQLLYWQMGSFSLKDWKTVFILLPITVVGILIIMHYNRELDMLTFGEEQAKSMGVNTVRVKWILIVIAAAITGSAISFVGVIGFVDLVAPHIVRKIFGSRHRLVIPMSAILGGAFMVACDLAARTVIPKQDLPVGAVTAIIGAPFFGYVYFSRRKRDA
ncbi:MAG: iron ABC transporter permease [Oscillospiraceae bacterium]|jgi:iron complex transport system permease protein|nr:iron ABC transporter permease [Oscillospiraceae bacterium]